MAAIQVIRESHEAPAEFQALLREAGGTNPNGEAMYRFVWGQNRTEWIGGRWTDRDESGTLIREVVELREVLKYAPPVFSSERWYVERWYPPALPRAQWEAQTIEIEDGRNIPALGPYPERGDYKHFFTMEGPEPEKAFRQLTPARARWMAMVVRDSEHAARKTLQQEKDKLAEQKAKEKAANLEVMDDDIPAFGHAAHVTVL